MELRIDVSGDDDEELRALVDGTRRGSPTAFTELGHRVLDRVRRWATRFTGDADEAEDVAQLVLLRLHSHIHEFEGRSRFTSWLWRITRNVAADRRVRERRRSTLLAAHARVSDRPLSVEQSATRPDVERAAVVTRLVAAHRDALNGRQRTVFDLVDLQDTSVADVAQRLSIAPSTVRVLLARARRTIRLRILEEHPTLLEEFDE